MRHVHVLVLATAAAALSGHALAVDVYKWKDSKGVVHYGDRPASGASAALVDARDDRVDPAEAQRARQRLSATRDGLDLPADDDEPAGPRHAAPRKPPPTGCAAAWQRYDAAQACFDAHRVAGGKGVTRRGTAVCQEIPQPSCMR